MRGSEDGCRGNPTEPSRVQPMIVGDGSQHQRFVQLNAPVLAGASRIIIEAHNGCAGLAYFYKADLERIVRQGRQTPYFELQRQLLERGIEHFARRVAALSKRDVTAEANYVDFGSGGSVVEVTNICTIQVKGTRQGDTPALLPLGDIQRMWLWRLYCKPAYTDGRPFF